MKEELDFWGGSDFVYYCLVDKKRTLAFRKALKKTIKSGDIVADLGSGTGIFTYSALEFGAKKVYLVESDPNLFKTLKRNIENSKFKDQVVLMHADASKVQLPEKLDVVVCEMVATGLIQEYQVPVMNHILNYCKNNVRVLPYRIKNYIDLVNNNDRFYGHKIPIVRYEYGEYVKDQVWKSVPFTEKFMYKEFDFTTQNPKRIDASMGLKILRTGLINGIRISNKTIFPDKSTLESTLAYCMPIILPIKDTKVKKGDLFNVSIKYDTCSGLEKLSYKVSKV